MNILHTVTLMNVQNTLRQSNQNTLNIMKKNTENARKQSEIINNNANAQTKKWWEWEYDDETRN